MKYFYLTILWIGSSISCLAQDVQITGKIFDGKSHNPLSGAHIQIADITTVSDKEGNFTIPCQEGSELTVNFVSYETYRYTIKNCGEKLNIGLMAGNNNLNEVEITTTSNANKTILYQPTSINKLGPIELKRGNGLYLTDAINTNVPGVLMESRSVSGGQELNIRGYGNGVGARGANNNFDGQGYKVYLNGIPVTDAEGITLMDDIDFNSIGNVEVIKGPAGSLYGLAIAGVVNLSTLQPEKGTTTIGQDVMLGSYGLQRYTTHLQMGGERSSLLVNYGHQTSDGYMVHNNSRKDFTNVSGSFQPNKKQTITAYVGYSNSYDQRGGELTIDQYNTKDYSGNPAYIKNNAHSEIISVRMGLGSTYVFNNHFSNTTSVFGCGVSNNSSSAAGWTDKDPINYGVRSTLDVHYHLGKAFKLTGITGIEAQSQVAQIIGYGMVADSNNLSGYNRIGAIKSDQAITTFTYSAFTEWSLSLPHDFSLTAGVGISALDIRLKDRFYVATSKAPTSYGMNYNNLVSPHLALNKVFSKSVSAYISYSKGYKPPVSSNIFIPAVNTVNTTLKPEIGNQFEIGTKGSLLNNKLTYQLAIFDAKFSNKMTSVAVPLNGTTTAYTYTANGGSQDDKGLEILVKYNAYQSADGFIRAVNPFANFTYSDFKYKDFNYQTLDANKNPVITDYSGLKVAGVAPVTANVGVDILTKMGIYANLVYSYRDAMPISSDGLNSTTSFGLLNGKIGIQRSFAKQFDVNLFFGANNITGQQYYNMVFINQLPDAYLPSPDKINYFGGISLKYSLK